MQDKNAEYILDFLMCLSNYDPKMWGKKDGQSKKVSQERNDELNKILENFNKIKQN